MKNTAVKFSLTLVCAAVLAACSSSGGGDSNKASTTPAATTPAATTDTTATTNTTATTTDTTTAATTTTATGASKVGHFTAQKRESNFDIADGKGNVKNSETSAALGADVQNLHRSLDTIVVAQPQGGNSLRAYLEDYDFRGVGSVEHASGDATLNGIYLNEGTANSGNSRAITATKTNTQGTQSGAARVYEEGRKNYTGYEGLAVDKDSSVKENVDLAQKLPNTVTEVYGYRTFAQAGVDVIADEALANLPLTKDNKKQDAQLSKVQYGRVTSQLDERTRDQFKDGKQLGTAGTFVVDYGNYKANGTEDHYFYRGVDNTSASQLEAAKTVYNTGELKYAGHAVSYGLNDSYRGSANIPNAIGYADVFVEGNKVAATVNLDSKAVSGSVYNTWASGTENPDVLAADSKYHHDVNLVNFTGTLANNGDITGTAVRQDTLAQGVFNATVFGANATELGGSIASNDKGAGQAWGSVFGATIQNAEYVAPVAPAVPRCFIN